MTPKAIACFQPPSIYDRSLQNGNYRVLWGILRLVEGAVIALNGVVSEAEQTRSPVRRVPSRRHQGHGSSEDIWTWPPLAIHIWCDRVSEALIYFMLIFSPWAFGSTDERDMNILNGVAAGLGALLAGKWIFRWRTGYRPLRWGEPNGPNSMPRSPAFTLCAKRLTWTLAMLSVLVPAYCWLSGWNARALYVWNEFRFQYFPNYI